MNFLALMIGLAVERLLTHLFHLREFNWLNPLFDAVFARLDKLGRAGSVVVTVLLVILLTAPVAAAELALADRLVYVPVFVFSVVVLLFCLGPRDLVEEVDDYRAAIEADDREEIAELATQLLEREPEPGETPDIEGAVYAQANNRIFGVVFWFVVLGATGAWVFRVLDLLRRRAIHRTGIVALADAPAYLQAILQLHYLLAWIPARLLLVGYTLAGNYDTAMPAWRSYRPPADKVFPGDDDLLLGAVGSAAASHREQSGVSGRARVAVSLVTRTLWMIWCPALALLTLYDWIG
ncbi:MAG: regulatory signaling modulator protein AmpE [Gammaproteobacteria bacterium]|nr:regulatory signaling modulator protein AmpE [Gammaproteobacteria bacterium]